MYCNNCEAIVMSSSVVNVWPLKNTVFGPGTAPPEGANGFFPDQVIGKLPYTSTGKNMMFNDTFYFETNWSSNSTTFHHHSDNNANASVIWLIQSDGSTIPAISYTNTNRLYAHGGYLPVPFCFQINPQGGLIFMCADPFNADQPFPQALVSDLGQSYSRLTASMSENQQVGAAISKKDPTAVLFSYTSIV